eukprot:gene8884-834_t
MSIVAFDLGTSFCRISNWWDGDEPKIIYTMPSVVSFKDGKFFFGKKAESLAIENPSNTIYEIKRVLGMQFGGETDREKKEMTFHQTIWPFSLENSSKGTYQIVLENEKKITIEEITSMILKHLKEAAEDILEFPVENVVITIPTYFDNISRVATQEIANSLGLNVIRLLTDTSAASLTYSVASKNSKLKNVLLYSLGGGSCSVSVFEIIDGKLTTKSASSNRFVGGIDFENEIIRLCCAKAKALFGEVITSDRSSLMKLKIEATKAMISLDTNESYKFHIKNLFQGKDFEWEFKREVFEKANKKKFDEVLHPVLDAIQNANIQKTDLNEIILFGGASKIPKILEILDDFFEGVKIVQIENPSDYVSKGAAIQGAILESTVDAPKKRNFAPKTPINSPAPDSDDEKKPRRKAPTLDSSVTTKTTTYSPIEKKQSLFTDQQEKKEKSSNCLVS